MAGIYLHIPFCKQACHYCDFHFSTNLDNRASIVAAITEELVLQRDYLQGERVNTVYFGGGTPSLLSEAELNGMLDTLYKTFPVNTGAEFTLEANPDDLTKDKLASLRRSGINRLSIGIQSFDDAVLKFLNRAHNATLASQCVVDAYDAGFENISIDLIYAIPDQTEAVWEENIQKALNLNPQHISSYSLTIEQKTAFGRWAAAGKLRPVDDDLAGQQLQVLVGRLEGAGFDQYEVSNFALPGFQSRHNSSYWKSEAYLGVGPSAHSYNGAHRQFNISNNSLYLKALQAKTIPATREELTREDQINDYLLTTLRTAWGADLTHIFNTWHYDVPTTHGPYLNDLLRSQYASLDNNILRLTRRGKLLADKIASDLFLLTP
ncbi:radical SAM family heme chaperone HemW [Chryseolinea lacunae]|uniref:Heme chaperone HemW n=1 Tax=Chryseolinea lacunae TaxID=2801331 RepID=A0ABS1KRN8_9BACT|nr:radical SAM family heme chaperone HemW [Chryseolinea lacunae]MBL0742143.1 radical SAM family heme chaperone HemW [Chryseolinea lacunae]